MKSILITYKTGEKEVIDNVFDAVDHGGNEISFFIGSGFTRYHALDVMTFEIKETSQPTE